MSKKFIIFLLLLIFLSGTASALNNSTSNVTVAPTNNPVMEKLTENFYGTITYADGNPLPAGTNIIIKDQYKNVIGNYTTREIGIYGSSKPYGDKLEVIVWRNQSDRASRSSVVFVNFFVDGVRSRDSADFKVGESENFNILLPIMKPTPLPTTIATTIPTLVPTTIETIKENITIVQITPTPIVSDNIFPGVSNTDLVVYGVIGTILVIIGMIFTVIVQSYLMNKSNRDDSLGPEDKR